MSTHNICFRGEIGEALLMSTHNICFRGEIRKIFTGYPLLSRPMYITINEVWEDKGSRRGFSNGLFI